MSNRSSLYSESAASELDPHFRSLKEPINCSYLCSHLSNPPYSPCSSLDSPISIPPTVSFPLPPRRLRPGEIVGIKDFEATASPADRSATPANPASLYGVAIGGSAPTKTNPATNGRAEVQTDGLTSLDLRKRTLRARVPESQPDLTPSPETVNLRARNPSRMLAPPHLALQSPSRYHLKLQSSAPSHQNLTRHVSTLPRDPISMATSSSPRPRDLSRPPRNHSLLESTTNPIPRLPNTRLAYQSLSYDLSNSYELPHQTLSSLKQPLDEALSVAHPPTSNFHRLQSDLAPLENISVSHNRIKFAPLPNKPSPPAYALSSKSFSKKKTAWIGRWLSPNPTQASKPISTKTRPEISLPVLQTLVITGTGTVTTDAMVPALPIKRRRSVNDEEAPKVVPHKPPRPRSRSFSSTRPTLGMVANMVQRSPSRSVEETLASGKTLLHGSQHIYSPTRGQSLRNLVSENSTTSPTKTSNMDHNLRDRSEPPSSSAPKTCAQPLISSHSIQGAGMPTSATKPTPSSTPKHMPSSATKPMPSSATKPMPSSATKRMPSSATKPMPSSATKSGDAPSVNADAPPSHPTIFIDRRYQAETLEFSKQSTSLNVKPAKGTVETTEGKKKREIRFRNTLELIPDPVFKDPAQIVVPAPIDTSSESVKRALKPSDARGLEHFKRKVPARNLNPFSHLRKPRNIDSEGNDQQLLTAPFVSTQGPRQLDADTTISLPNGSIKHNNLRLPRRYGDPDRNENVNLCSRKLAPKVNLTFVDLDHHIGSRFSVNTLLKEVQKSLPDVLPNENPYSNDSARSHYDPIAQTERKLTSRKSPESVSEDRSEEKDGSSSDSLVAPTTATSASNPVDLASSNAYMVHSGHNSVIEVVKTNGADVVFQMVVPVNSSGMKTTSERTAGLAPRDGPYHSSKGNHPDDQEDELTVISERLVALNKSIQAREAHANRSESNQRQNPLNLHNNQLAQNLSTSKRKINRIENWLSNVPSPLASPVNKLQPPNLHLHSSSQFLKVEKDELETLEQYPESPIDRHHMPPRPVLKAS